MLSIYCVHPISGLTAEEVFGYYERTQLLLNAVGYDVYIPMFGKGSLRTEMKFKSHDYRSPLTKNHAIYLRDKWMVEKSDILYANFLGSKIVSIGSVMELGWGSMLGKQNIVVMEKDNIHQHSFVLEAATIVFDNEEDAIEYLTKLFKKEY